MIFRLFTQLAQHRAARFLAAAAISVMATVSAAQAWETGNTFAHDGDASDLNFEFSQPLHLKAKAPNPIYNRAKYPQLWSRYGVHKPYLVELKGDYGSGNILIDQKNQYLYVSLGQNRAIEYPIIVGRDGLEIKDKTHKISRKEKDPTWDGPGRNPFAQPGPQNPLGVRGLYLATPRGVEHGFLIHGTNQPDLLARPDGQRKASHGCIRMFNDDVMDVFERVPAGARVSIYFKGELMPQARRLGTASELLNKTISQRLVNQP